jgi:hypothetical protein
MAKGKGSSGSHGHGPGKQHGGGSGQHGGGSGRQHGGGSGSNIDVGKILDGIRIILGQLGGDKPSPEPKPTEPSGAAEPKAAATSQAELKSLLDVIKMELAKEPPDKQLIATLLTKIQDGIEARGGDAGSLTADLADTLKKLKGLK